MTKEELFDRLLPILANNDLTSKRTCEKVAEVFGDFLLTHALYCRPNQVDTIFDEFNSVMASVITQIRRPN